MTAPNHFALFAEPVRRWVPFGTVECGECEGTTQVCVRAEAQKPYRKWWRKCDACTDGRVPVVPSWPCPTCGGSKTVRIEHEQDGVVYEDKKGCPDCNAEGVVHEGWLALGAAAHDCWRCDGGGCEEDCGLRGGCKMAYAGPDSHRICGKCNGRGRFPASLSELVRVQRVPVVDEAVIWRGDQPHSTYLAVPSGHIWLHEWSGYSGKLPCWSVSDITDQFSSPPNPGDLVWRIVERVTLSDPITGWPCPPRPCIDCLVARIARKCTHRVPVDAEIPLPQQVGWYQADDVLVAEIERRKP